MDSQFAIQLIIAATGVIVSLIGAYALRAGQRKDQEQAKSAALLATVHEVTDTLRQENKRLQDHSDSLQARIDKLTADNDRIREQIRDMTDRLTSMMFRKKGGDG